MKRADLDKRAARDRFGPGKHGFQSGNPSQGVLPTIPGAEWFNHVQEEIAHVIESTGEELNPQQTNQLKTAILHLITQSIYEPKTASTRQKGEVQLSSAVNNDSEATAATSKAVKQAFDRAVEAKNTADGKANTRHTHAIADITGLQTALNSKLEASQLSSASTSQAGVVQLSSAVNSESEATAATSKAVKQAFDRAVEAEGKGLPVGAIVAFHWAVKNPEGYLLCNGGAFSRETYPDLYRVLGNRDRVPHLSRSDIGQTAYFPIDAIPNGWIAFDDIERLVTRAAYRELYDLLVTKYGSIAAVPKAADRYIRGNGNGLEVGATQEDELKSHSHRLPSQFLGFNGDTSIYDRSQSVVEPKPKMTLFNDSEVNHDNGWILPKIDTPAATGGSENRPKTIVFKLCIKALNTFNDVRFWIKAFGSVSMSNEGSLNAAGLSRDLQALRTELDTAKNEINGLKARPATPTDNTPSGTIAYFAGNTAPQGWLKANGAAVSRTTYANLFRVIGTTYGAGSNSSTFNLPDLRGEFIRGFDDGRNVDAGRTLGSAQLDAIQEHAHSLRGVVGRSISGPFNSGLGGGAGALLDSSARTAETPTIGNPTNARTASETRPRNIALLACIKI